MNGLQTARVVVIDDDPAEAQPIIMSLGRMGVPVMYCAGVGEQPQKPLRGVRLVFMDLYMSGVSSVHTNAQTAVNLLAQVVDISETGVGLVLWTTHTQADKDVFCEALRNRLPQFAPAFIKDQEKTKYTAEDADFNELWNDIRIKLDSEPAHAVLMNWEQAAHDAASQSTELLRNCATETAKLQEILGAMAKAGGPINTPDDAVSHLYQGLNTILMDASSAASRLNPGNQEHVRQLREWSKKPKRLSIEISGRINGVLLLDQIDHDGVVLRPGNIYAKPWRAGEVRPCPAICFKPTIIYKETGQPCVKHEVADLEKKLKRAVSNGDGQAQQSHEEKIQKYASLHQRVEYAVVEITPACDFANGKAPTAKFVGGILIAEEDIKMFELRHELRLFLREIGPFRLERDGRIWYLMLNAKLLYTRPWPTSAKEWKPLCRMRDQLLVDVQHWVASYSSRPGFFSVR